MPRMIDNPKHKYRRFLLTYEQARVCIIALANLSASLYMNKDPSLVQLRKDAQELHTLFSSYRWERNVPP